MKTIRAVNDGLAFLLEMAALAALALWGFTYGPNLVLRILLAVGAPVAVAALWGRWLAPRAGRRLHLPW
ncbi:MAG: YrdB family protein, partial [Actinomycetota bacterium]|nr:YrdB family protein [Actinomycetota bacterium]